jgi:hypothetical protein
MSTRPPAIHPLFPLSSIKEENNTNIYLPSLRYILGYSDLCINPLKTKLRLLYLNTQSVPRCYKNQTVYACKWHKLLFVLR